MNLVEVEVEGLRVKPVPWISALETTPPDSETATSCQCSDAPTNSVLLARTAADAELLHPH